MKWFVQLSGHKLDLEELPKWLAGGEFSVEAEEGKYFLTSSRFDDFNDPGEVRRAAEEVIELINGLGRLQWPEFEAVGVGSVESRDESGARKVYLTASDRLKSRDKATVTVTDKDGNVKPPPDQGRLTTWIQATEGDRLVQRALGYLNKAETSWNDLYRAVEVVQEDVDGEIIGHGWASNRQLVRFRRTANSYSVLGYAARHGIERTDPPSSPMTFPEARQLVLGVVRAWIESKVQGSEP